MSVCDTELIETIANIADVVSRYPVFRLKEQQGATNLVTFLLGKFLHKLLIVAFNAMILLIDYKITKSYTTIQLLQPFSLYIGFILGHFSLSTG